LHIDEEYDEKVMGIPESFKSGLTNFLSGKEDHDSKTSGHDPACNTGTRGEIYVKESNEPPTGCCGRGIGDGKLVKVDHVGENVDNGKSDYGPGGKFVESDVFIKGDDAV
jgi:hypothetical protein